MTAALSVSIHEVSWDAVLAELERQIGATITVVSPLAGRVSRKFKDLPLDTAFKRLFAGADLLPLYSRRVKAGVPEVALSRVWVIPKGASAATATLPSGANARALAGP